MRDWRRYFLHSGSSIDYCLDGMAEGCSMWGTIVGRQYGRLFSSGIKSRHVIKCLREILYSDGLIIRNLQTRSTLLLLMTSSFMKTMKVMRSQEAQ